MRLVLKFLKWFFGLAVLATIGLAGWLYAAPPALIRVGAGYAAKIVCSNVLIAGRNADEVARMPKEELLEEIGIPLSPVRLKCAILGFGTLKVALHKSKGTPLPDEWSGGDSDLTIA